MSNFNHLRCLHVSRIPYVKIQASGRENREADEVDLQEEEKVVASFLRTPCPCSRNCQEQLDHEEVTNNRAFFRSLGKNERNYVLVMILKSMLSHSEYAMSGRSRKSRERKKFDYRVGIDRPVCQAVFLFYLLKHFHFSPKIFFIR